MANYKPIAVKKNNITSTDVIGFGGGLDERSPYSASIDTFSKALNMSVDTNGFLVPRPGAKKWLPSTVGNIKQIFPVLYNGQNYYFVCDDGKVKYIQSGDDSWTDCGGDNEITTTGDIINSFVRTDDKLAVVNGVDEMRYIDLSNMEMVQYNEVTDPSTAPTANTTGMTGTTAHVYYAISFNGNAGETEISPILDKTGDPRNGWSPTVKYMTVTRNNEAPEGSQGWNLYICLSSQTGTPTATDMLLLASDLDIATTTYIDDGSISPQNILAPTENTTKGAKVKYGIEQQGIVIFWGDPDNPYRVYIGGIGKYSLQFSPTTGGYVSELHKGTNYYPLMVTGFRTGQGLPAITVLFGNTQGISKQSTLTQQTVTVGDSSQSYWTESEQNYGAPSVASPYGLVNYNGTLFFVSYNGIMTIKTNQNALNVLNTSKIDKAIPNTLGSIRSDQFEKIVATAWDSKVYFTAPTRGYTFNNQIMVYDQSNEDKPIWYVWDIQADYIGVISTSDQEAFIYFTKDNNIFRLEDNYVAQDEDEAGIASPFATSAEGTFLGFAPAHNFLKVVKQATFYIIDAIGNITEGVTWRDRFNKVDSKSQVVEFGKYSASTTGGWDDPYYTFDTGNSAYNEWDDTAPINANDISTKATIRSDLSLDNLQAIELAWKISTQLDFSSFKLRSVSYEGVNIGIRGDIR